MGVDEREEAHERRDHKAVSAIASAQHGNSRPKGSNISGRGRYVPPVSAAIEIHVQPAKPLLDKYNLSVTKRRSRHINTQPPSPGLREEAVAAYEAAVAPEA